MKYFRAFLLTLLTVLLPIRGAVAAAMLCPGGATTSCTPAALAHAGHAHPHQDASHGSAGKGHATGCPCCAGGCGIAPLAFALPALPSARLLVSAAFDPWTARVTAFYPDGLDRPPRSI